MHNKRLEKHSKDFTRLRIAAKVAEKGGYQGNWKANDDAKRKLGLFSWDDPDG